MRTWASALLAVLVCVALFMGDCGSSGPSSIALWHAYRGDEEVALNALVARYQREHGVRIEVLALPFDAYAAKLAAAVPHAHGPDVFIDAHERVGSYKSEGIVAPAGDAFPDEDIARYDAVATRAVTDEKGTRYGVPLASKCLALYVNEALMPETPATLEALAASRGGLPEGGFPIVWESESPYTHAPLLHAFGGAMLDEKDGFGFVGKGPARSVVLVRELAEKGAIPDAADGALVQRLFAEGKAKSAVSGPWLAADLKSAVRFRIEPLPRVAETSERMRPLLTVDAAFVTPMGSKRADVRAFARFLGSTESATVRATQGHQIVTTTAAWSEPEVAKDKFLASFHEATREAVPMPTSVTMRATWVPAQQAIRTILRGGDAEAALVEAKRRFDDLLRPPPPPPSPTPALVVLGLLAFAGALLAVKRARAPGFAMNLRASVPAYKYVAHAAVAVIVLVVLPLFAGAVTSFFAGARQHPEYVGVDNYVEILTARGGPLLGHGSFYLTLLVTVAWTVANVTLHLALGVALGLALSKPLLRFKAPYRVLLILPWAVPSYVTSLAWKGMFHRQYGAVNAILTALGAEPVSWFAKFSTAFTANIATNVWLGFPFMMVVTMGALTAIPKDVLEAADVDGATRFQRFRLVTLPLLLPSLLPSVILGAVWTFNMFNVVFLVSGGEPDGQTDILVSEAYRWAFTRDANMGYAAAYAVLIFFLLLFGTRLLGRLGAKAEKATAA